MITKRNSAQGLLEYIIIGGIVAVATLPLIGPYAKEVGQRIADSSPAKSPKIVASKLTPQNPAVVQAVTPTPPAIKTVEISSHKITPPASPPKVAPPILLPCPCSAPPTCEDGYSQTGTTTQTGYGCLANQCPVYTCNPPPPCPCSDPPTCQFGYSATGTTIQSGDDCSASQCSTYTCCEDMEAALFEGSIAQVQGWTLEDAIVHWKEVAIAEGISECEASISDPYEVKIGDDDYVFVQDKNKDGKFNGKNEILGYTDTRDNLFNEMKSLDMNGDGYISSDELQKQGVKLMKMKDGQLTTDEYSLDKVKGIDLKLFQKTASSGEVAGEFKVDLSDNTSAQGKETFKLSSILDALVSAITNLFIFVQQGATDIGNAIGSFLSGS